jgi:hypothetical protein
VELIVPDLSRIVYLTNFGRKDGGVFQPDLVQKVLQNYSFLKFPSVEDLQKESFMFGLGKFQGFQINELNVYNDGIIVSGKCNTNILEAFLAHLLEWVRNDFGLEELTILKPETHFESSLLVKAEKDLTSIVSPPKRVANLIEKAMARVTEAEYQSTAIYFETDSAGLKTRRRPNRFTLERRVGVPFAANVFYSQAPMRSDEHFALLQDLEGLAD